MEQEIAYDRGSSEVSSVRVHAQIVCLTVLSRITRSNDKPESSSIELADKILDCEGASLLLLMC